MAGNLNAHQNLIWIDLEMTGLDVDNDTIIEIATIVTDAKLNIIAEGPCVAINQPESRLEGMDDWNTSHHTRSGLVDAVRTSKYTAELAEKITLDFLALHVPPGVSPMCGNSICQDRRFLYREMPALEQFFHYRNLDVSSLKELVRRWSPELLGGIEKKVSDHRALSDIRESIEELRYYREHFIKLEDEPIG